MAWALFLADFDARTAHHTTVAWKAGMRGNLTREHLAQAIALGAARAIRPPSREQARALAADPYWRGAHDRTDGA